MYKRQSLKASTGVDINLVPYKGGAQAVADMLGGHIQMNFGTTATLLALIKQGKLRPLAVTGDKRSPELPDTPTMAESGFPKLTLRYWMGVWAPPHTPKAIVETLNANVVAGLKTPELLAGLNRAGFEALPIDANAIGAFMQSESPKWLDVARTSGVKGD